MEVKRAIAHYIAPGSHTSLTTAKAREALHFEHGCISAFLYGDVSNRVKRESVCGEESIIAIGKS